MKCINHPYLATKSFLINYSYVPILVQKTKEGEIDTKFCLVGLNKLLFNGLCLGKLTDFRNFLKGKVNSLVSDRTRPT